MQYQDKYLGFVIDYSPAYEDYRVSCKGMIVASFKSYDEAIAYCDWVIMSRLPKLQPAVS